MIGLFVLLVFLLLVFCVMVALGHGVWLIGESVVRAFRSTSETFPSASTGERELSNEALGELLVTERQLSKLHLAGSLDDDTFRHLVELIDIERAKLQNTAKDYRDVKIATSVSEILHAEVSENAESVPFPTVIQPADREFAKSPITPPSAVQVDNGPTVSFETKPEPKPKRSFSEMLNSFMEESNIRWGEIIGGLLIIGCSTALVVSLWSQISQIPVLKFLIFTTVTAVLFGIGLYTEHRWKLPTTSRGILTIATLLVPLNFLAIAAVSSGNSGGVLVLASELIAPAIFLCLVYFAGRVITPGCAHLLSAGVLGSSVGQLLVRHFASIETQPDILFLLGAFPVVCYLVTMGLALKVVLLDREIDESETTIVFTMLGAMSFAAALPFGLLLYKAGMLSLSLLYLAPLVTLWGVPMLATGTILWRRINDDKLVASRTAGGALAVLGVFTVVMGVFLAWPNPSSVVPAALLNFAIISILAFALDLPLAHLVAIPFFALASLVGFQVGTGGVAWHNLRVTSLLNACLTASSGNVMVGVFLFPVAGAEFLLKRGRQKDAENYIVSACSLGVVSLVLATYYTAHHGLWLVYLVYALSCCWFAVRYGYRSFSWLGSALLLIALDEFVSHSLGLTFPWQTAFLVHATLFAVSAILSTKFQSLRILVKAFNATALITCGIAVLSLFQANPWQVTWMQSQRVFWIAGITLLLLWLNRRRLLFTAFQMAVTSGAVLTVKAALQEYEWYTYLPHAFMHPAALQIQGTVLAVLGLAWVTLRLVLSRPALTSGNESTWFADLQRVVDGRYAVDRIISWGLVAVLLLLAAYGSFSGVTQELAARGSDYPGFNIAGFPHAEALSLGSWIVLGFVSMLMLAHAYQRHSKRYLLGALVAFSSAVPLIAGLFEKQIATATAWRWLAALFLIGGSIVIWCRKRFTSTTFLGLDFSESFAPQARRTLLAVTITPLLVLTLYPALRAIYYLPVEGPASGLFALLNDTVSYSVPLAFGVLALAGYAIRERLPRFAFWSALLLNTTITLGYLLTIVGGHHPMDRMVFETVVQLNAIAFSAFALPWLAFRNQWLPYLDQSSAKVADSLLLVQVLLAVALNLTLVVALVINLLVRPETAGLATIAGGSITGWLAFVLTLGSVVAISFLHRSRRTALVIAVALMEIVSLCAFMATRQSGFAGLHTLAIGTAVASWLMLLATQFGKNDPRYRRYANLFLYNRWTSHCWHAASTLGVLTVLFSFVALTDPSASDWWSLGPIVSISVLAATLNWQTRRPDCLFAAGSLASGAFAIWWFNQHLLDRFAIAPFLEANIIAACLLGVIWLALDLRARSKAPVDSQVSFHTVVALASLITLTGIVWLRFPALDFKSQSLVWPAMLSVVVLLTACLWDQSARFAPPALYFIGLLAGSTLLQSASFDSGNIFIWWSTIFVASYTILTAVVWHYRTKLITFVKALRMQQLVERDAVPPTWFLAFTIVLAAGVIGASFWINLSVASFVMRLTAAVAVATLSLPFYLLWREWKRSEWQIVVVSLFLVGLTLLAWSWLSPGGGGAAYNRSVILMSVVLVFTAVYALMIKRIRTRDQRWFYSVRTTMPWILLVGGAALFFSLSAEVVDQLSYGSVVVSFAALLAVVVTLIAAVICCVLFAWSGDYDPLGVSERMRANYVYAAEVLLALLFLHVRLTLPWLFTGFFERYWPFVVMAIAYLGVATSEALRRKELVVIAEPLSRTGAFLPLLPVLGFWAAASEVDFSLLLFLVGGLYGLLSILRKSFAFGVIAAIAGNGGLWYLWHRTADLQLFQHPQLWLIPVALSVLVAAYLNEEKLSDDQLASVRYLSLVTIYASSTADIFINGVENSPWLPLILSVFSLAGIFSGIVFRIRGLLFLGAVFLLLSIITMIWFASANLGWTWLWYVAGIMTGATIIFMFAVFEKKRSEVLRVVEGLKDWDK